MVRPVQSPGEERALVLYDRLVRRRLCVAALLVLMVAAAFLIDLILGPSRMTATTALSGLFRLSDLSPRDAAILWQIRLPVALMAVLVGAALALAGAEMQTILDNPLASPFTLGMSSAGTLGAALAIVLGLSLPGIPQDWILPVNAFAFAFGSALLLQGLSRLRQGRETLVLIGIVLFFTFNAFVAMLQFVASDQVLQQLVFWSMGSLVRASWDKVVILACVLAVIGSLSLLACQQLTTLRLGIERARSFGLDVERIRFVSLLRISILTGTAVAFVGTIGFVGLVGPHIARLMVGEDHRFFLPLSMLSGAFIMSVASIASKMIIPGVLLPIGIVTALIGVPCFLLLILTRGERA